MDLEDVDLEPGEDAPLDRLREPQFGAGKPGPEGAVRVVGHARELHLHPARALLRAGRGEDARGRGEVEPVIGGDPLVVVDRRPRPTKITCG